MQLTVATKWQRRKTLLIPLLTVAMASGCSSLTNHSKTWPVDLNVIELSDGGICMDEPSAKRLAEFKAELEAI
ncbi:hypothetical protein D0812_22115 [Vibrio owensii]|uniref:Uncharacterized protein n=1 Tax=Vibrio owensii TaxID=696485 RepID=A0ABM6ZNB6_9VIBR|nr:hypothetical protein D0812_22115 [Vibrio owensii]